ncbi:MAG: hypothetical protein IH624_08430 [Phycisphaerae bacterium]|nr:hypothetical protein [Phycisphaerae bacterium]
MVKIEDSSSNDVAEYACDALGRRIRMVDESGEPWKRGLTPLVNPETVVVTNGGMWERFMKTPSIECLDLFESEYKQSGELGDLRNHNMVLMDIGEWQIAKVNCEMIIEKSEHTIEDDFINLGMIEWFLENTSSAIKFWKESINTQFAACPGAPDTPLILWYAGQRLGDEKLVKQSLKKLKRYWKVEDYREFSGWRGTATIAGFLLDKVPDDVFLYDWKDEERGSIEDRRLCRANFWAGMKCLEQGDETAAVTYFKCAFSGPKIAILQYEYFLAKWEYANMSHDWSVFGQN